LSPGKAKIILDTVSGVMLIFRNFRFAQLSVHDLERKKRLSEEVMRRRKEKNDRFKRGKEGKNRVTFSPLG
jgi:hypothetical protein